MTIICPACAYTTQAAATAAGRKAKCPKCQKVFAVPAPADNVVEPPETGPQPPAAPAGPRRPRGQPILNTPATIAFVLALLSFVFGLALDESAARQDAWAAKHADAKQADRSLCYMLLSGSMFFTGVGLVCAAQRGR